MNWFQFRNAADGVAEIIVSDVIGGWLDSGQPVTAKSFLDQLASLSPSVKTIRLRVNSPGGDAFAAVQIANALREQASNGRTVEAVVEGLAASAASVVVMGAQNIRIADNALMMIHDPSTIGIGNASALRNIADRLDMVRDTIVTTYKWHSSLKEDAIRDLMAKETWMDADAAIANGFAHEKIDGLKAAACIDRRALASLDIPESYRAQVQTFFAPDPVTASATEVLRLCREHDCLDMAEDFIARNLSLADVQNALTAEGEKRRAAAARATEIRALCETAHLTTLADGYVRSSMSVEDVRNHLTTITALMDSAEIDGALLPDATRRKPRIDVNTIFAERNKLTKKE